VEYRMVPAPPVAQYAAAPAQYAVNPPAPSYTACDPLLIECGLWGIPGIYPTSIVVIRASPFRRFHPGRGGHPLLAQPPMHATGHFRRG